MRLIAPTDRPDVKTTIFEKISYGMGDVACNVVFALTSGLVVYFYTNVMSISAGLIGTIMLLSRIFDGISDIGIGVLMDKVHSKHGKARAWILWMIIPYAVTAVALFSIPKGATGAAQALYIFVSYNLCTTVVYTALNLPYAAMAPLMTSDEKDLSVINVFRMSMSPIGNMIVSACTLPIINRMGGTQEAWVKVTLIYSIIAMGLLVWCFLGTRERVHIQAASDAEKLPLHTRFKAILSNKYFYILILASVFLALYTTIIGTTGTYYAEYILGNNELYGVLHIAENIPQIITIMLLPFVVKFGKRNVVLAGALLVIVSSAILTLSPANFALAVFCAVCRGIGKAPLFGFIFTMTADVVNYGHWKTGIRVDSMIFTSKTAGQKLGGGIAGWLVGELMEWSGFTGLKHEIPSAVAMVKNMYIYGSIVAWAGIAVLMLLYHLDKEYDGIMKELNESGAMEGVKQNHG